MAITEIYPYISENLPWPPKSGRFQRFAYLSPPPLPAVGRHNFVFSVSFLKNVSSKSQNFSCTEVGIFYACSLT